MNEFRKAYKSGDNMYMTELAVTGSVFYLQQAEYNGNFQGLCSKLGKEYRAYTDKGKMEQKQSRVREVFKAVERDFQQTARTREQSVLTAKLLYQLADSALRLVVEESLSEPVPTEEPEAAFAFG